MEIAATFVSKWDNGTEIRTHCVYFPKENRVEVEDATDEEAEFLEDNVCVSQYIEIPDGTILTANFEDVAGPTDVIIT